MKPLKILIVGGGIAGMSAAIVLRRIGAQVDLVELDPQWRVYGAGITLSGPTLRAFERIGIIDELMTEGWCADDLDMLAPNGSILATIPTPRLGRPDVPGAGGILRPVLARILRERTLSSGAAVRCGTTFRSLDSLDSGVQVLFEDGREERYDLAIGADGLHSKVRTTLFPESPAPRYTGQVSWRAVVPRPPEIQHGAMMLGPKVKAGINPISKSEMYLFVTQFSEQPDYLTEAELPERLRMILSPFAGVVGSIRDGLDAHSRIVYRPFFTLLLRAPWFRGRCIVIGDAAHATTPHLATGAGIGVEDAVVLSEELVKDRPLEVSLDTFMRRRFERCRMVVENSLRLGDLENTGDEAGHAALMRESMSALLAPY